jgi:hypothetical protein
VSDERSDRAARRPAGTDGAVAVGLGLALYSVYLITFSGEFRSIDELTLFAIAENLVQAGSWEPVLVRFAAFHNPVGGFEPGYSALAAGLYAFGQLWRAVSNIHAVMLLNPLLTAATGSVLYRLGRQLAYPRPASLMVGLAFGLGSMAWPFTQSFLREPAVGLLWTAALWGAARCLERPTWRAVALAGGGAALAVAVKGVSVAAVPVIVALVLWAFYRAGRLPRVWLVGLGVLALVVSVAAGPLLRVWRGAVPLDVLSLLASPFTSKGITPWYGLLFSPGKSLFLYSPVLILGVLGWPAFFRRHGALALAIAGMGGALLFVLSGSAWWGGLTWGPRFLLPLVPVSLLPALELFSRRWWAGLIAGLSAVYQAVVTTQDWSRVYQLLFDQYPGVNPDLTVGLDWRSWADSPAVLLVRAWDRSRLDFLWLQAGLAGEIKLDAWLGLGLLVALGVTGGALLAIWRGWHAGPALGLGMVAAGLATAGLLGRGYWALPDYSGLTADTARQLAAVTLNQPAGDATVVLVSPDFYTYPWLGLVKRPGRRVWVSPAQTEGFENLLTTARGAQLIVVIDRPHIASNYPGDRLAGWLNAQAYRLSGEWVAGYEVLRYADIDNPGASQPASYAWPTGVGLAAFSVPREVAAGEVLPIDLMFERRGGEWAALDRLFTNLVGPDGVVVAGHEDLLLHGNLAAEGWAADTPAHDRRGLWIPAEAPRGTYSLVVGFSNAGGFVPVSLGDGQTADYADLVTVIVK